VRTVLALLATLVALAFPVGSQAARGLSAAVEHVDIGPVTLGYRVAGPPAARPLVLVMGFAGTMADWDPALVDALARTRRVIAFDNRGMGTSSWKHGVKLTVSLMAEDTARLIDRLGLERVDVLGWSMGGNIAQMLALRHPAKVRRLVLAATDPGSPHAVLPAPSVLAVLTDPAVTPRELVSVIFPQTPAGESAAGAYFRRVGEQPGLRRSWLATPPTVVAAQAAAEGPARWLAPGRGAYGALPRLRLPTLVADGLLDVVEPPENSRLIASRIPHARLRLYPGAGHAFLFQDHARFARDVRAFLG
jgi:pimeloyl-ACP methyl ester carboxylesterase